MLEMIQKQVWYAGILTMMVSVMYVMANISDPAMLGPNIAVVVLTLFYAAIFEMLLLPLVLEVKGRIINYMDLETDMEAEAMQMMPDSDSDTLSEPEKKTEEM